MDKTPTFADFNPTSNPDVDYIKQTTDALIAFIKQKGSGSTPDAARRAALAATNYEQAAMWAVKALFS